MSKTILKFDKLEPWKRFTVVKKSGGAGIHKDKRTKRNRTRSAQNKKAIREYD